MAGLELTVALNVNLLKSLENERGKIEKAEYIKT